MAEKKKNIDVVTPVLPMFWTTLNTEQLDKQRATSKYPTSARYGLSLLIDKNDKKAMEWLTGFQKECQELAKGQKIPAQKFPYTDGDTMKQSYCHGAWVLTARCYTGNISILNPDKSVMRDADIAKIKWGDKGRIVGQAFYNEQGKPGVLLSFSVLQFAGVGKAIGSGPEEDAKKLDALEAVLEDVTSDEEAVA